MRVAAFISPHGFGHAARAVAILARLAAREPELSVDLYTLVPEWFFSSSLPAGVSLTHFAVECDVGFEQLTPLKEDLPRTVERLSNVYPPDDASLDRLAVQLKERGTSIVLCDISALGILVAERARVPSLLVENFTWDFIYRGYAAREQALRPFIEYLAPLYDRATYRVQTIPVCEPKRVVQTVGPVSRACVADQSDIRAALKVDADKPLVMISMGGVKGNYSFLSSLEAIRTVNFLIAGVDQVGKLASNIRTLPHRTTYYHPDLVRAADVIVGKVGYSTVAEAFHGRTQFFYVPRANFPESYVMEEFVRKELCGVEVAPERFDSGEWIELLPEAIKAVPSVAPIENGAEEVALLLTEIADS